MVQRDIAGVGTVQIREAVHAADMCLPLVYHQLSCPLLRVKIPREKFSDTATKKGPKPVHHNDLGHMHFFWKIAPTNPETPAQRRVAQ